MRILGNTIANAVQFNQSLEQQRAATKNDRQNAISQEQKIEIKTVPPQGQKNKIKEDQKAKRDTKSTPAMADKFKSEDGDGKRAQQQQNDEQVTFKSKDDDKVTDDAMAKDDRKNAGSHEQKNEIKTVPPQDQKDNIRKDQKAKKEKNTPAMADKFKSEDGDGKSAQQQQKDEPVTAKSKNDAKAKNDAKVNEDAEDDTNNAKSVAFDKKASSPAALVDDKFKVR